MEMLKIEDLKKDLYIGEFGEYLQDYDNGYLCDIITEIADNNVCIYWNDLLDWAKGNSSYIDDYVQEVGIDEKNFDFFRLIQGGQYLANEQDLYENFKDIILNRLYNYIVLNLGITEITEEQNDEILTLNIDDNDELLENLFEEVDNIFNDEIIEG